METGWPSNFDEGLELTYIVKVDDREFRVDVERDGEGYIISLNGERRNVVIAYEDNAKLTLIVDNKPFVIVREHDENQIRVDDDIYTVHVLDEQIRELVKASPDKPQKQELAIKAIMPGLVVDVNVEEGDTIKNGDGLLVVEAMKMQNEIKASRDGKVRRILVRKGQTVNSGETLIVIE
jgi:biotin carboxyl carrier protein